MQSNGRGRVGSTSIQNVDFRLPIGCGGELPVRHIRHRDRFNRTHPHNAALISTSQFVWSDSRQRDRQGCSTCATWPNGETGTVGFDRPHFLIHSTAPEQMPRADANSGEDGRVPNSLSVSCLGLSFHVLPRRRSQSPYRILEFAAIQTGLSSPQRGFPQHIQSTRQP